MSRIDRIRAHISDALYPVELTIEDDSTRHAGHAGAPEGSEATHLRIFIVSEAFQGLSRVARHQLVYGLLQDEFEGGLHALNIVAKTPEEAS